MSTNTDQSLDEMRNSIDQLDDELLSVLAKRFAVTEKVGHYKKAAGIAPVDPDREARQFAKIERKAQEAGLDPDVAHKVFRLVIDEVVKRHKLIAETDQ
jgi:chorismate mutase